MFKFNCEDDKIMIKIEGPWSMVDTILTLKYLKKNFRPSKAIIGKVVVWMRLSNMPFDYWDR